MAKLRHSWPYKWERSPPGELRLSFLGERTRRLAVILGLKGSAELLLIAAREPVREVVARHKANGDSIVVWRDGQVVILRSEKIELKSDSGVPPFRAPTSLT